jgi:hypothetical protein
MKILYLGTEGVVTHMSHLVSRIECMSSLRPLSPPLALSWLTGERRSRRRNDASHVQSVVHDRGWSDVA